MLVKIIALIPCRGGSKRIPNKNVKPLAGKPLLCWTIDAAQQAGIFDRIVLCPDATCTLPDLSAYYGIEAINRPESADDEPDIAWVRHVLSQPTLDGYDAFAILRPTSPFRAAYTIHRAFEKFKTTPCSSLRAVEPVKQHPGKMWQTLLYDDNAMEPLMGESWPFPGGSASLRTRVPWHSQPTQSLPTVYAQNASLEIAWTWCVTVFDSISGPKVTPFFTNGWEGFDINTPEDWERAERHAHSLLARV